MCYYTDQTSAKKNLEKRFEAQALFEASLLPSGKQSGFSHPSLPIITQAKPGLIQLISWGLIPAWATAEQALTLPNQTLNAKSETIFEKASFEPSVLRQRCLVLVDGFFEWQTCGKEKIEYRIELSDPGPFALAGIYAIWMDPVTRELNPSFSILTTAANPLMEEIHNTKKRMPVILSPEAEKSWISPMPSDEIKGFLKPFDEEYMRANPVRPVLEEQLSLF